MKKLFISQPMRGKTDEEILAVRAKAIQSAERVLGEEVDAIDSFFKDAVVQPTVLSRSLWFPSGRTEPRYVMQSRPACKGYEPLEEDDNEQ